MAIRRSVQSALCMLAVSLWGCAPSEPLATARSPGGPSEYDLLSAMEAAEPVSAMHGGEECRRVRQLRCLPSGEGPTFRCTYRYERDRLGTALVERDRHGFWRWASGPRNCTSRTLY